MFCLSFLNYLKYYEKIKYYRDLDDKIFELKIVSRFSLANILGLTSESD